VVADPTSGTGVLRFTYRKPGEAAAHQSNLALVTQSGGWKVCQ
jgi:hypothetical protein